MQLEALRDDPPPRLYGLDALRGLCAIAVMLYHFYSWNGTDAFQVGYFGVYIFFILSGFSLWYVYRPRALDVALLRSFFVARVARVAPLYVLVVALMIGLRVFGSGVDTLLDLSTLSGTLLNVTFLFGTALPGKLSMVIGGWSLGIEAVFYCLFPVFLLFAPRLRTLVALSVVAVLVNQLYVANLMHDYELLSHEYTMFYTVFPVFLVYFLLGVLVAEWYRCRPPVAAYIARWPAQTALKLLALACLGGIFFIPVISLEAFLFGPHYLLMLCLSAALMMATACIRLTARWEQALYRFLGDISYATYLMHYLVYLLMAKVLQRLYPDTAMLAFLPLIGLCAVAVAYVVFRLYEMPMRRYLTRRM